MPPSSIPALVGRERELAALTDQLSALVDGHGRMVLVAGEPGIGKTRLIAAMSEQARQAGAFVLTGHAYESDGLPPYLPFIEALRAYVRTLDPATAVQQLGSATAQVALLVPELQAQLGALPAPPVLPPEQAQYRLFDALTDLLFEAAVSAPAGLVLVLEDLHWSDGPTLLLLQHLVRRLAEAPVLVVGSYRTVDLGRSHPLQEVLANLSRTSWVQRIRLRALPEASAATLVHSLTAQAPAVALMQRIYAETAGNPFFLTEVVRYLQAEGCDFSLDAADRAPWGIPEGVRQVIGRRLSRLDEQANQLLAAAAVLGDGFAFEVLGSMLDLEQTQALAAFERVLASGLVEQRGEGFAFSHALVRQTLYAELSLPRRHVLHLRAAQALEEVYAHNLGPHVAVLSGHYRAAGSAAPGEKVYAYALRAGEEAAAVFAFEGAALEWRAALTSLPNHKAERERRATVLQRLGQLMYTSGADWNTGLAYLEEALKLFEQLEEPDRVAEVHTQLGFYRSTFVGLRDVRGALAHFRAAQAALPPGPVDRAVASLYTGFAQAALYAVETQEGLAASARARAAAEQLGDPVLWATAAALHGAHLVTHGQLATGRSLFDAAWSAADRENDSVAAFVSTWHASWWSIQLGDPQEGKAQCRRELAKPRAARAPLQHQRLLYRLGTCHLLAGELDEAVRLLQELPAELGYAVDLAYWAGDWEQAETIATERLAEARRAGTRLNELARLEILALVLRARGDLKRARALLLEVLAIADDGNDVPHTLNAHTWLALIALQEGGAAQAEVHVARCRAILDGGEDWRGLGGRVAFAEALVALRNGRSGEGERLLDQAAATFRRYRLPWDEAESCYLLGWHLIASGAGPSARQQLEAADVLYRRHGAGVPWLERVRAGLQAADAAGGPGSPRTQHPDGLTAREVEVLRLLATGKSNQQIADGLVLSTNTVATHIKSIFNKTGVANRTEAAAFAHRRGLADRSS